MTDLHPTPPHQRPGPAPAKSGREGERRSAHARRRWRPPSRPGVPRAQPAGRALLTQRRRAGKMAATAAVAAATESAGGKMEEPAAAAATAAAPPPPNGAGSTGDAPPKR